MLTELVEIEFGDVRVLIRCCIGLPSGARVWLITGYRHGLSHAYPSIDFSQHTILEKPVGSRDFLKAIEALVAGRQPHFSDWLMLTANGSHSH